MTRTGFIRNRVILIMTGDVYMLTFHLLLCVLYLHHLLKFSSTFKKKKKKQMLKLRHQEAKKLSEKAD